jgi:uncharacterized protein
MEFDNTFSVAAPIDEVWTALLDVQRVAPCVPGAQVLEQTGENAYKVAIKVKLGPVSMTYRGGVEVVEQDDGAHRAVMSAKAKEARGQGTADATVELRLAEAGGRTAGTIHTDVAISGKAAAMGQGVIADVSARLIDTFAANLAAMLAAAPEAGVAPETASAPEPAAGAAPGPGTAPAASVTATAALAAPQRAAPAAPPSPPPPAADGLPVLSILGGVLAARLRDPRAPAGVLAAVLLVLRRRRRRRRR